MSGAPAPTGPAAAPGVVLIDASIWIFRAHFGMPAELRDDRGRPAGAVQGWVGMLLDELARDPPALGIAFDTALESGFRHRLWPAYKAQRTLPDAELARQLEACRSFAEALGLCCASSHAFEADDLIAAAAARARADGVAVEIVSRDKDLLQLITGPADRMRDAATGRLQDRAAAAARFGVPPERIPDLQALAGDRIDGIPGIEGIGERTAARLLARHADLETLFDALARDGVDAFAGLRGAAGLATRLHGRREDALLFRTLARAHADVDVDFTPHRAPSPRPDGARVRAALAAVGLGGRLRQRIERIESFARAGDEVEASRAPAV